MFDFCSVKHFHNHISLEPCSDEQVICLGIRWFPFLIVVLARLWCVKQAPEPLTTP